MKKIGLSKELRNKIVKLILSYKKPEKIVLFGSRATGYFERKSDIDIAIFSKNWDEADINEVRALLEEKLSTPLKMDILDFCLIHNQKLKNNILKEGSILYESSKVKTTF